MSPWDVEQHIIVTTLWQTMHHKLSCASIGKYEFARGLTAEPCWDNITCSGATQGEHNWHVTEFATGTTAKSDHTNIPPTRRFYIQHLLGWLRATKNLHNMTYTKKGRSRMFSSVSDVQLLMKNHQHLSKLSHAHTVRAQIYLSECDHSANPIKALCVHVSPQSVKCRHETPHSQNHIVNERYFTMSKDHTTIAQTLKTLLQTANGSCYRNGRVCFPNTKPTLSESAILSPAMATRKGYHSHGREVNSVLCWTPVRISPIKFLSNPGWKSSLLPEHHTQAFDLERRLPSKYRISDYHLQKEHLWAHNPCHRCGHADAVLNSQHAWDAHTASTALYNTGKENSVKQLDMSCGHSWEHDTNQ